MSLKKFMHPRNRYKQVPDFKQLAVLYPEFRQHVTTDLTGKVKVDFTNKDALRSLTETLLKHDFKLEVKIPDNKLVPTLPLRLNYILWIEDLMTHCSLTEMKNATGLDIGTGAVCIYPLLLANLYGTKVLGTEVDETSVLSAKEHVDKNNYKDLITVLQVNGESILKGIVQETEICHFSMCNPPFFEMDEIPMRPDKKLPPRNAATGNEKELTIEGGERGFVSKMIEESIEMKEKIKVYTTMLGQKSTLFFILKYMKKREINNLTWTEFCQGHTKRWGIAWTFLPKTVYDLTEAPVIRGKFDPAVKMLKEHHPVEITFPLCEACPSFDQFVQNMREIMKELNLEMKELTCKDTEWNCHIIAKTDTWSHARRKRRLAQRGGKESEKQNTETEVPSNIEKNVESPATSPAKQPETDQINELILVCNLYTRIIDNADSEEGEDSERSMLKMCMVFHRGTGGKNSLITFREYLVNRLKIRDLVRGQSASSGNSSKKKKRKKNDQRTETEENQSKSVRLESTMNESGESSS